MDSGNAPQGPPLCMSGCGFFGCVPRARRAAAQRVGARIEAHGNYETGHASLAGRARGWRPAACAAR